MCIGKLKSRLLLEKQRFQGLSGWPWAVCLICAHVKDGMALSLLECLSHYCIAVKKQHEQDKLL